MRARSTGRPSIEALTTGVRLDGAMARSSSVYRHEVPLGEIVADKIRRLILNGHLQPGARLVERDFAAQLEVSRSPVREALRILDQEGLVEKLPTRGIIVKELTRREVVEIFDIREALEGMASRLAAERIAGGATCDLEQLVANSRAALKADDLDAVRESNWGFHDEIIAFSDNEILQQMLIPLMSRLHWVLRQITDFQRIEVDHLRLAAAIESGYPDLAAVEAQQHVRTYRTITLEQLFG
jgi:DNA-binding GntR family transcriptional regulator